MKHYLDIKKEYLERLISGKKKFEIRKNERDYQVDDILVFDRKPGCWEIDNSEFRITHVYSGAFIDPLYVILSLEPILDLGNETTKGTKDESGTTNQKSKTQRRQGHNRIPGRT